MINLDVIRDAWRALVDGPALKPSPPTVLIDCPVHGRTTLYLSRQTACCASLRWIPSGKVKSRLVQ